MTILKNNDGRVSIFVDDEVEFKLGIGLMESVELDEWSSWIDNIEEAKEEQKQQDC